MGENASVEAKLKRCKKGIAERDRSRGEARRDPGSRRTDWGKKQKGVGLIGGAANGAYDVQKRRKRTRPGPDGRGE